MRPHLCPCKCCSTSTDLITVYCAGKATAEELMKRQKVEEKLELLQRENTMLLLQLKSEQLKSEQLRSEQLRSERNKARKETQDVATSTDSEATSSESLSSTHQRRRGSSPECGRAGKRQRMSDDDDDLYW